MDYSTRKRRDGTSHLQCVLDVSPRRRYARNRACPAIRIKNLWWNRLGRRLMNLRLLLKRGFAKAGTEGVPFHSANEARKRLSKSRAKTIRLEGVFKARRLLFITPLALLPDVQQNRGNKFRV